ncbi:peptidase M60-like family-domain-containing protein [Chytriomyces sp. MP71]|nr:peptidase M60-like family-domain-containing protein [Chytriomyces sp. MP71]
MHWITLAMYSGSITVVAALAPPNGTLKELRDALQRLTANPRPDYSVSTSLATSDLTTIGTFLLPNDTAAIRNLTDLDGLARDALQVTLRDCITDLKWTAYPILATDVRRRTCSKPVYALRHVLPLGPDGVHPLVPAAAVWPGVLGGFGTAPVVTREWTVRTDVTKWLSSGLYVAPGGQVQVRFCPAATVAKGGVDMDSIVGVQIGSCADTLWDVTKEDWKRFPAISEYATVWVPDGDSCQSLKTTAHFGGLLYLDLARKGLLGKVTVSGNVVQAPRYNGAMSTQEWNQALDTTSAPYGEMEFNEMVLSYPVSFLKQSNCYSQPKEMKTFYDKLMPEYTKLSSEKRSFKERLNVDLHLSTGDGTLHSGYPIQFPTYVDPGELCAFKRPTNETEDVTETSIWGLFHEIGHNYQQEGWSYFQNTTEVSVNIFSIQMTEIFAQSAIYQYSADLEPNGPVRELEGKWRATSIPYGSDSNDFFMKLLFYIELRQAFGYEAFRRVFADYRTNKINPLQEHDQIDEWARRFSKTVQHDISPFMRNRWRIPVSDTAARTTQSLAAWSPDTLLRCTSTPFAFGLSPCAEVTRVTSSTLRLRLGTWATLRRGHVLVVGLEGPGMPAAMVEGVALTPARLILFDSGVTVELEFPDVFQSGTVKTSFWIEDGRNGTHVKKAHRFDA